MTCQHSGYEELHVLAPEPAALRVDELLDADDPPDTVPAAHHTAGLLLECLCKECGARWTTVHAENLPALSRPSRRPITSPLAIKVEPVQPAGAL